jgi:outer membrane protein insertion porin family
VNPSAPAAPPETAPVQPPESPSVETGDRIVGIRVVGYQTVSPDTIAHYLGIKVGDPYDPEKIRANFRALWDVGLLENLEIHAERSPGGVTLVITIEERPVIKFIDFTGNKKLSTSQIKDKIKEAKVEIQPGSPLSLKDLSKMRASIYDFYVEQGFRSASVDFKIEDLSKTEKKVTFVIDEGDKVKIESIKFTGNDHVSAQTLRNAMHKTKIATWWRLLSENTTYSQANYEADVESMKGVYQSKGYKDVVIKDPKLEVYVVDPKSKKQKRRVRITIPVVEGDKFFVNVIKITRTDKSMQPAENTDPTVFPRQALLRKFNELKPGSVLNRDRLIEALMGIEQSYKARGYIFWFADPVYQEIGNHKVDIDIHMYEGDKYYLGRLEVQGNTQTRDKVIRREFALDEGDVMNMEAVKKSSRRSSRWATSRWARSPASRSARRRRRSTSSSRARRRLATRSSSAPATRPSTDSSGSSRSRRGTSSGAARSSARRRRSGKSRTTSTSPTRCRGGWTATRPWGPRSTAGRSTTSRSTS